MLKFPIGNQNRSLHYFVNNFETSFLGIKLYIFWKVIESSNYSLQRFYNINNR